jgi:retron-type reverse transcriptase
MSTLETKPSRYGDLKHRLRHRLNPIVKLNLIEHHGIIPNDPCVRYVNKFVINKWTCKNEIHIYFYIYDYDLCGFYYTSRLSG